MTEGWFGNEYWALFEEGRDEEEARQTYGLVDFLPGYRLVGLRNWDDFVIRDEEGRYFKIPTVPLAPEQREPFEFAVEVSALEKDGRFENKVKWYLQPLVFGGDPQGLDNLAWVTHEQHRELVKWWAAFYRTEIAGKDEGSLQG